MLYEINKYYEDTSLSFKSVRFPKLEIFVEIFCVGVPERDTHMAAGK